MPKLEVATLVLHANSNNPTVKHVNSISC